MYMLWTKCTCTINFCLHVPQKSKFSRNKRMHNWIMFRIWTNLHAWFHKMLLYLNKLRSSFYKNIKMIYSYPYSFKCDKRSALWRKQDTCINKEQKHIMDAEISMRPRGETWKRINRISKNRRKKIFDSKGFSIYFDQKGVIRKFHGLRG